MGYCPKLCCDQGARQLGAGARGTAWALGAGRAAQHVRSGGCWALGGAGAAAGSGVPGDTGAGARGTKAWARPGRAAGPAGYALGALSLF